MGEVPVAILEVSNASDIAVLKTQVQKRVEKILGVAFRPAKVFTVQDLGLDAFPKTANGKLYKQGLREKLAKAPDSDNGTGEISLSTVQQIVQLWQRLTGVGHSTLNAHSSVVGLVDSLLIIRFCYDVEKKLGKRITFAQVVENDTPTKQAAILDKSLSHSESEDHDGIRSFLSESSRSWDDDFPGLKREKFLREHIRSIGLNWDHDVEDMFQPQDSTRIFWASTARSNSSNHRFLYKLKGYGSRIHDIETALKKTLQRIVEP